MSDISNPIFHDVEKARKHLEKLQWPDGPVCPHCGALEATKLTGKSHRPGLYQCNACRDQFTVTVGTVFERSKVPLNKWLLATHLLCASKKGISTHQLHRMLGVTYKTAWFMTHRIREAMKDDGSMPLGGEGKIIEADETFIGGTKSDKYFHFVSERGWVYHGNYRDKWKVLSLVERGGRVRSIHIDDLKSSTIRHHLVTNVDRKSRLMTDEAHQYNLVGREFASHQSVKHSAKEYVRGDVSTNTVEGFFSIFKRGMKGIYQHCGEQHLQRYLAEFDFRYSHRKVDDNQRRDTALKGIIGKRLTYRRIDAPAQA